MARSLRLIAALLTAVHAGNILWDGRFNDLASSTDLQKCTYLSPPPFPPDYLPTYPPTHPG
jgi:hypothetical protein